MNILVPSFKGFNAAGCKKKLKTYFCKTFGTKLRKESIKLAATHTEARKFVTAGPRALEDHKHYSN